MCGRWGQCGPWPGWELLVECNAPRSPATAEGLCFPEGVAVDGSGHLYVADTDNNRVLEYDTPLTKSTADRVFGQGGSFTTGECNGT